MARQKQAERKRITKSLVEALELGEIIWDLSVTGFFARRQKGDARSYGLYFRTKEGRQRWHTIGRHGAPWTADTARDEAKRLLGEVVTGSDPAADKQAKRHAETVSQLCDRYIEDAEAGKLLTRRKATKRPSTISSDKSRIESHIRPLLGAMKVASVTNRDVEKFMHDVAAGKSAKRQKGDKPRVLHNVRGGQGAASRTVGLLGAIFTYAVKHRMRSDNPVAGVMRPADGKKDRRLSDEEYAALGAAFRTATPKDYWPPAIHAIRFLALTGWRSGEALGLKRADVDFGKRLAVLAQTKSGKSIRHLSTQAVEVLKEAEKLKLGDSDLFFPSSKAAVMSGFPGHFEKLLKSAGLPPGISPHTLRHSFASVAGDLGLAESSIGVLLGHSTHSVTSGYVHRSDPVVLALADEVAASVAERMGDKAKGGQVIQFPKATA